LAILIIVMKSEFRASYYDIAYNTFISDIIITLRNHSLNCSTKHFGNKIFIIVIKYIKSIYSLYN